MRKLVDKACTSIAMRALHISTLEKFQKKVMKLFTSRVIECILTLDLDSITISGR